MKALIVMMVMAVMAVAYPTHQVFMVGNDNLDAWGEGVWGESSFEISDDSSLCNLNGQPLPGGAFEFNYPLETGYDDDLWFDKGVTYSVRLAEGSWPLYTINQWFPVDEITVPTVPTEDWFDSISLTYWPVSVSWRLIDDDTLRFRFVNQSTNYTHIFMVFPIPESQDLSPSTWASIKAAF
ncbi:MAG: hypothetical protein WC455_08990 [Dehalococcoidia bacterium]